MKKSAPPRIDAKIDLHGLTIQRAYHTLLDFVEQCIEAECSRILVVTGKGEHAKSKGDSTINAELPHWCESAAFSQFVKSTSPAHIAHGGAGAYYLNLKN